MNHLCWVNHAIELGFAYETELKRKVVVKGVVRDLAAALSPSFASKAKFCPTRCWRTSDHSAGNTSVLMATTSGRPNRSRMGFGRCEIPAPRSSMLLSVRFGTNSAMTP